MNLEEFLSTANADDAVALAEAKAYVTTKVWRIEGAIRKTQVETTVIVNDTIDRLEANIVTLSAIASPTPTEAGQLVISKAILRALNNLYNPEFYINLADPTVASMFANAQALGVLTQPEIDGITEAATYAETPFASTTIDDVKAIRYPSDWTACDHGAQAYIISTSNEPIAFSLSLTTTTSLVRIRCYWSTAVGSQEFLSNRSLAMDGTDSLFVSQMFTRQSLGLPTTARVLRFEYKTAHAGVANSLSVSK